MTEKKKVLIIEDEPKIAQVLVEFLAHEGFEAHIIDDGNFAIEAVKRINPSIVLLDLMLPNKDGLTICKEIRQFSNLPIIMLTARVDEIDRLLGLNLGADDYICKPFSPREVVARVHAVLRRFDSTSPSIQSQIINYKMIEMDLDKHACHVNQTPIQLTPVEFRLLSFLLKRPGFVHTRETLMTVCYDDDRIVSNRTIDSHMKNLRNKINHVIDGDSILYSVYGVGYKIE